MTNPMFPAQAVEAAEEAVIDAMIKYGPDGHIDGYQEIARAALEAAAPHIIAGHFREMNLKAITNEIENPPNFSKVTP